MDHRALVNRVSEVCPLPANASRVLALTGDPDASMSAIVEAVSTDPALSAEVMRIASSPAYATRCPPTDLHAATTRLGLRELHDMASAMAMLVAFRSEHELSGEIHERALFSANLAHLLAAAMKHPRPRTALLCGLLCEIGALACLAVDADAYIALRDVAGADRDLRAAVERDRYGATSWEIGAALLERNALPKVVCGAVRGSADAEDLLLAAVTRLSRSASALVFEACRGGDTAWVEHVHAIAEPLGIDLSADEIGALVIKAAGASMAQCA